MTDLVPVTRSATEVAALANQYAAATAFTDYQDRKAKQTLRQQKVTLKDFAVFLKVAGVSGIDPDEYGPVLYNTPQEWHFLSYGLVKAYIRWMYQQGYAIKTINVHLSTLRIYAELASQAGAIPSETLTLIQAIKGYTRKDAVHAEEKRSTSRIGHKKPTPIVLTREQMDTLKHQHPDTPQGRRDALLMCFFLDHGLRCGEVASLTADCIHLLDGKFSVYRAKVDKKQTHKLTQETLLAYLRYKEVANPETFLFMGSRKNGELSGRMTDRAMTKRVNRLGRDLLGIENLSAHDNRDSWATAASRAGTRLEVLQQAGGWNSLEMPRHYIQDQEVANDGVVLY